MFGGVKSIPAYGLGPVIPLGATVLAVCSTWPTIGCVLLVYHIKISICPFVKCVNGK